MTTRMSAKCAGSRFCSQVWTLQPLSIWKSAGGVGQCVYNFSPIVRGDSLSCTPKGILQLKGPPFNLKMR